jgi:hypothetical protein
MNKAEISRLFGAALTDVRRGVTKVQRAAPRPPLKPNGIAQRALRLIKRSNGQHGG